MVGDDGVPTAVLQRGLAESEFSISNYCGDILYDVCTVISGIRLGRWTIPAATDRGPPDMLCTQENLPWRILFIFPLRVAKKRFSAYATTNVKFPAPHEKLART